MPSPGATLLGTRALPKHTPPQEGHLPWDPEGLWAQEVTLGLCLGQPLAGRLQVQAADQRPLHALLPQDPAVLPRALARAAPGSGLLLCGRRRGGWEGLF